MDGCLTLTLLTHGNLAGVPSTDETHGPHVSKKSPPESWDLLLQVCCWAKNPFGGINLDAKSALDRRGEEPED